MGRDFGKRSSTKIFACYIKNDRAYNIRSNLIQGCENIFVELLLPKSRPILVGIIYIDPQISLIFLTKLLNHFRIFIT